MVHFRDSNRQNPPQCGRRSPLEAAELKTVDMQNTLPVHLSQRERLPARAASVAASRLGATGHEIALVHQTGGGSQPGPAVTSRSVASSPRPFLSPPPLLFLPPLPPSCPRSRTCASTRSLPREMSRQSPPAGGAAAEEETPEKTTKNALQAARGKKRPFQIRSPLNRRTQRAPHTHAHTHKRGLAVQSRASVFSSFLSPRPRAQRALCGEQSSEK